MANGSFWTSASYEQFKLFLNFEDSVLVQILSYRRKLTYQPLVIGFSHELISVQDVVHNMLHLNVAKELL